MNTRSLIALLILTSLSGCAAPTLITFNDHEIEYENIWSAQFPPGAQITHMDKKTIRVKGTEPIRVNGTELWADEKGVRIGPREFQLASDDRLVVDKRGQVHVVVVTASSPRASGKGSVAAGVTRTQAPEPRATRQARTRRHPGSAEPAAGTQEDTSLWGFLR